MGRRIVWTEYQSSEREQIDGYFDRLLKYIPADVVAFWLTVNGFISSIAEDAQVGAFWMLFVAGLVLSFFWTRRLTKEPGKATAWRQIAISCISFAVWVFSIGGPFATLYFYEPHHGSILLLIYTAALPLLPAPPLAQQ